jgi:hypothetical protein
VVYPEFANIVKGGKHRLWYKKMIPDRHRAETLVTLSLSKRGSGQRAEGRKGERRSKKQRAECIFLMYMEVRLMSMEVGFLQSFLVVLYQ